MSFKLIKGDKKECNHEVAIPLITRCTICYPTDLNDLWNANRHRDSITIDDVWRGFMIMHYGSHIRKIK